MEKHLPILLGFVALEYIISVNGMFPSSIWSSTTPAPAAPVDVSDNWKVYKQAQRPYFYKICKGAKVPEGVNPEPEVSTPHAPVVIEYGSHSKVFMDGHEYTTSLKGEDELDGTKEVKIIEEKHILETIDKLVFRKIEVNFTLMYANFLKVLNNLMYVKIPEDQRKAVLLPRTPEETDYHWLTENIVILDEHSKSPQINHSDTGKLVEKTLQDSEKSEHQRNETPGLGAIEGECKKLMQILGKAGFEVMDTPINTAQETGITDQLRHIVTVLTKQFIRGSEVSINDGTHDNAVETLTQATIHIRTVIGNEQVTPHGTDRPVPSQAHDQSFRDFAAVVKTIGELSKKLSERMEGVEQESTKIAQTLKEAGFKIDAPNTSNEDHATRITAHLNHIGVVLAHQLVAAVGTTALVSDESHESGVIATIAHATSKIREAIGKKVVTQRGHDNSVSNFVAVVKAIGELSEELSARMEGVERECTKITQTLQKAGFKIDAPSTSNTDQATRITAQLNHIDGKLNEQLIGEAGTTALISDESHDSSVIATISHATSRIKEAIGNKWLTQHGHDNGIISFAALVEILGQLSKLIAILHKAKAGEHSIYISLLKSIVHQDFAERPWHHEAIDQRVKIGVPMSELQTMGLSVFDYREAMYFTYHDVMAELRKCLVQNDDQQIRRLSGIGNPADHTSAEQLARLIKFLIKLSPHATAQPAVHRIVNLVRPWVIPFADKLGSRLSGIQPTLNEMASHIQHQKETPEQPEAGVHSNGVHSDGVYTLR